MNIVHNSSLKTSERNVTVDYCDTNYLLHFVVVTVKYTLYCNSISDSDTVHCNTGSNSNSNSTLGNSNSKLYFFK